MATIPKWTVRNLDEGALEKLKEVQEACGLPLGEILSDAIKDWYSDLPSLKIDKGERQPLIDQCEALDHLRATLTKLEEISSR